MPDFWPITFKGLHATCNAFINDSPRGTVLLSLVGSATVLNGLWAAFLSNDVLSLPESISLRRIPRLEDDPHIKTPAQRRSSEYRTVGARLKETGKRHVVIVHQQATQACGMDQSFFVLSDDGQIPLLRFYPQFNRAVAICAREQWSAFLWEHGLAKGLIVTCQTGGIAAWRVEADGLAWATVVRDGIVTQTIE